MHHSSEEHKESSILSSPSTSTLDYAYHTLSSSRHNKSNSTSTSASPASTSRSLMDDEKYQRNESPILIRHLSSTYSSRTQPTLMRLATPELHSPLPLLNALLPRTPTSTSTSTSATLASLTIDSNARAHRFITSSPPTTIPIITTPTPRKRVVTRTFATIGDRIDAVIAERQALFDVYIGKDLTDDIYLRDEIDRKKYGFYRINVPSGANTLKLEIEMIEGKCDICISNTEMYAFSKDKDFQWHLRASTGHHSLLIAHTDPCWKTGDYYITCHALTHTHMMLKCTTGGKMTRNGVTARNATQSTSAPSHRNIRRQLDMRIKNLLEDSKAYRAFQSNIRAIRASYHQQALSHPDDEPNFLLSNIMSMDEQRPEKIMEKRLQWKEKHKKKMEEARLEHLTLQSTRASQIRDDIQHRHELHEHNRERARLEKLQRHTEAVQKRWLYWMSLICRDLFWIRQVQNLAEMRADRWKRNMAAIRIQRFIRAALLRRRKRRAEQHLQSLRSCVLLFAYNHHLVKKDRAATVIKLFLEQCSGVDSVARVVKNFRKRVTLAQRCVKTYLSVRHAKLYAWNLQWERMWKAMNAQEKWIVIGHQLRDSILSNYATQQAKLCRAELPDYYSKLQQYQKHVQMEAACRMVMKDYVSQPMQRPMKPHLPTLLDKRVLLPLMREAHTKAMEQAAQAQAAAAANQPAIGKNGKRIYKPGGDKKQPTSMFDEDIDPEADNKSRRSTGSNRRNPRSSRSRNVSRGASPSNSSPSTPTRTLSRETSMNNPPTMGNTLSLPNASSHGHHTHGEIIHNTEQSTTPRRRPSIPTTSAASAATATAETIPPSALTPKSKKKAKR